MTERLHRGLDEGLHILLPSDVGANEDDDNPLSLRIRAASGPGS